MIEATAERYTVYSEITKEIDRRLTIVHEETLYYSSHKPILEHSDFKWLVEQGDKIIPYLFHVITHRGCTWVIILLLSKIAPVNPVQVEHRGQLYHILHDWLGWYLDSEYHKLKDNIYHGLVE